MNDEDAAVEILSQAAELFKARGKEPNLAELGRETGLSRQRLRRWKRKGYVWSTAETRGRKKGSIKLFGFTGVVDNLLKQNVTNAVVIKDRLDEVGFTGGISILRDYVAEHKDSLVPPPRVIAVKDETKSRGMYYTTGPGECFQMDWGFVNVEDEQGNIWKCACFAMVCHHCGMRYIEFFPNAKQENLFIGMLHAFSVMGIPEKILTDNMRSVTTGRDSFGKPIFNEDYDAFQKTFGFSTHLCKIAHPFTKGEVERLVRYVKENFIQGRSFINISDLNRQALDWCFHANSKLTKDRDCIPLNEHVLENCTELTSDMSALLVYLAPLRSIDFEGFVNYEGRKFGVPLSYQRKKARVMRKGEQLVIMDDKATSVLSTFDVDWSKKPKVCPGQWTPPEETAQPEEHPTMPVKVTMRQATPVRSTRFSRFSICGDNKEVNNAE